MSGDLAATLHLAGSPALGGNDATRQYTLTLSLGGTSTCNVSTQLKDIDGNDVSPSGSGYADFQFISYGNFTLPDGFSPDRYTIASVSNNNDGTGVITARGTGTVVIEVRYAKVDESFAGETGTGAQQATNFIYAQIVVTVTT